MDICIRHSGCPEARSHGLCRSGIVAYGIGRINFDKLLENFAGKLLPGCLMIRLLGEHGQGKNQSEANRAHETIMIRLVSAHPPMITPPPHDPDRRSFLLGGLSIWLPFRKPQVIQLSGVGFHVMRHGKGPRRYLVIHGDEDTARDVLTAYMKDHNGIGYAVTGKFRNVEITGVRIDPNRMYSREGAERSIRNLNPGLDVERLISVLNDLDHERARLLHAILPPEGGRLFALHNNREYSVGDEISASDQTSVKQPDLPRNFFLCTDARDYEILKQSPYNVVLQSRPDPDDGSFSRLAARRGVRYINLECAIGEYAAQMERVRWLDEHVA